jgi:hypothetical protein
MDDDMEMSPVHEASLSVVTRKPSRFSSAPAASLPAYVPVGPAAVGVAATIVSAAPTSSSSRVAVPSATATSAPSGGSSHSKPADKPRSRSSSAGDKKTAHKSNKRSKGDHRGGHKRSKHAVEDKTYVVDVFECAWVDEYMRVSMYHCTFSVSFSFSLAPSHTNNIHSQVCALHSLLAFVASLVNGPFVICIVCWEQ